MLGLDSIWHWLVVLALALLFFGTGKLRNAGGDIGAAISQFKKSMREDDQPVRELPRQGDDPR